MVGTFEDVLRDMKNGVMDFTDNGKCKGCGECCSSLLPVSEKELKRIKRYVKEHGIKPQGISAVYAKPMFDLTCPFLRKDVSKDRCLIYPVRPDICVRFKCDNARNKRWYDGDMSDKRLVNMREEF